MHFKFASELLTEFVSNFGERRLSFATNRRNGCQTDHHDQGQHYRVLNSSWAVFRLQETFYFVSEILHAISPKASLPESGQYKGLKRELLKIDVATVAWSEAFTTTHPKGHPRAGAS